MIELVSAWTSLLVIVYCIRIRNDSCTYPMQPLVLHMQQRRTVKLAAQLTIEQEDHYTLNSQWSTESEEDSAADQL